MPMSLDKNNDLNSVGTNSSSSDLLDNTNMTGGGFLDSLFGSNDRMINYTKLIMIAVNSSDYHVLDFLLSQQFVPDLYYHDDDQNNILHSLASSLNKSNFARPVLQKIVNMAPATVLNHLNKSKYSPLHYVVMHNDNELANLMISRGAVRTETADDMIIVTDRMPDDDHPQQKNIFAKSTNDIQSTGTLEDIVRQFKTGTDSVDTLPDIHIGNDSVARPYSFSEISNDNSEGILTLNQNQNAPSTENKINKLLDSDSEFIELVKKKMQNEQKMVGGAIKRQITGVRKMFRPDEIVGGSSEQDDKMETMSELSRAIGNTEKRLDTQIVDKISAVSKKYNIDMDNKKATHIKDMIFKEVQRQKPHLTNLDKYSETLNLITKDTIKEFKNIINKKSKHDTESSVDTESSIPSDRSLTDFSY